MIVGINCVIIFYVFFLFFEQTLSLNDIFKLYTTSLMKTNVKPEVIVLDISRNFGLKKTLNLITNSDFLAIFGSDEKTLSLVKSTVVDIENQTKKYTIQLVGESYGKSENILVSEAINTGNSRSKVYECLKCAPSSKLSINTKLKITKDYNRFKNEKLVNKKLSIKPMDKNFVNSYNFEEALKGSCNGILMEAGSLNLKQVVKIIGPIRGSLLKKLVRNMVTSVSRFHRSGLCWTDAKLENFVLFPGKNEQLTELVPFLSIQVLVQSRC